MLLNYLFPCLCSRGATFPGCCMWRENILRLLTFLILLVQLPIRAPWSGVVRRPILECFHYEFIHIYSSTYHHIVNPHCSSSRVHTLHIRDVCNMVLQNSNRHFSLCSPPQAQLGVPTVPPATAQHSFHPSQPSPGLCSQATVHAQQWRCQVHCETEAWCSK